jgi:hypothetical protein
VGCNSSNEQGAEGSSQNPEDIDERRAKSIRVEDLGVKFVDTYTTAVGSELATLYMHLGMGHLSEMILELPIDQQPLTAVCQACAKKGEGGHARIHKQGVKG